MMVVLVFLGPVANNKTKKLPSESFSLWKMFSGCCFVDREWQVVVFELSTDMDQIVRQDRSLESKEEKNPFRV